MLNLFKCITNHGSNIKRIDIGPYHATTTTKISFFPLFSYIGTHLTPFFLFPSLFPLSLSSFLPLFFLSLPSFPHISPLLMLFFSASGNIRFCYAFCIMDCDFIFFQFSEISFPLCCKFALCYNLCNTIESWFSYVT